MSDPIDGYNPLPYPLQAGDFASLPAATVVIAGFDPMLDESNAYADALRDAGVDVTEHHYDDMIHSFFTSLGDPEWERAREPVSTVGDDIRAYVSDGSLT